MREKKKEDFDIFAQLGGRDTVTQSVKQLAVEKFTLGFLYSGG